MIDLSGLRQESRHSLHRLLYRQECRVWLLAVGMLVIVSLVPIEADTALSTASRIAYSVIGVLLAFWVGYPAQRVLSQLRAEGDKSESEHVERTFDDSWRSLWDFAPPLILPLLPFVCFLLYRMWEAR
ncbi:MAG: hypothetical protein QY326_05700 [Bdellovibrionota bacterium]|nr:MAG: hypothetical protein QY326_05700 [Bdellovibrionota bacterium]